MKTDRNILMRTRGNPEHFHITRLMSPCCLYSIFTNVFTLQVSTLLLETVTAHGTGSQDDHRAAERHPLLSQWIQCHIIFISLLCPGYVCAGQWWAASLSQCRITPGQCPCKLQHQRAAVSACALQCWCRELQCDCAHCHQQSVSSTFSL